MDRENTLLRLADYRCIFFCRPEATPRFHAAFLRRGQSLCREAEPLLFLRLHHAMLLLFGSSPSLHDRIFAMT